MVRITSLQETQTDRPAKTITVGTGAMKKKTIQYPSTYDESRVRNNVNYNSRSGFATGGDLYIHITGSV